MFRFRQSYVYDHAWCTKTGFYYGNIVYAGVLPDTAKDPRGVSHPDKEVNAYPHYFTIQLVQGPIETRETPDRHSFEYVFHRDLDPFRVQE